MALTYEELYEIQEKSKKKKKKKQDDDIAPVLTNKSTPVSSLVPRIPTSTEMPDLLKKYTPVAPTVTTSKKKDDRTWFQKGALEDGDWSKAILGSITDIGENISTGIIGMGEKAVDFLAMAGTAMGNAQMQQNMNDEIAFSALKTIGKDKKTKDKEVESIIKRYDTTQKQTKKSTTDFVKKDLYDEEKIAKKIISAPVEKRTGIDVEASSVFGEKTDALVQSGGQLLATAGLSALGVPWFLVTGATSFGAEAENAINQGATFEQATMSATISAGAEILTEKLSGGIKFGGKTLDDALIKPFTEQISNKVLKSLANLGIDALGEGSEEVISGILSNLGTALYKEESIGELLFSEEAVDEYIESFIGGAALGGASNVVGNVTNAIYNAKQNNAPIELTENEQKVVDKVVEDRIAEEKADGKKATKSQEKKIRDEVIRAMDKGYLDTDTIESVLGGEEYENYKYKKDLTDENIASGNKVIENLKKTKETLQAEYDTLYKMKNGEKSDEQIDRQSDLKEKIAEIETRIEKITGIVDNLGKGENLSDLKTKLGQNVFDLVKDSRLSESYKEIDRHKQVFSADVEQYESEYAKKTIQNAIDYRNDEGYGIDNTNASHDFIDLMTNYATDREVEIVFTTTKGLAELKKNGNKYGFNADPSETNAFVSKKYKKIFINMDTGKNLYSLVGHEVTHTVLNAKSLGKLTKVVKAYSGEAEYRKIYDKKAETYKDYNLSEAEIEEEIVADFCGEKLLTDYDFVMHLATNEQNIFQKAWDSIKYLYKMATAGSKEARQLEKAKRIFEKAYRESAKSGAKSEGVKNSLSDSNITVESTGYASGESYYTMSYKQNGKVVGTVEYGEYEGQPNVKMIEVDPKYRRQGIGTKLLQELQKKYPDEEIEFGMSTPDGTKLLDSITYDVTDEAVVSDREKLKTLQTELNELQEKLDVLYDVEIPTEAQIAEVEKLGDRWNEVYDSIRELEQTLRGKRATKTFVKTDTKYSLSPEQEAYFKDSKVRDENGNLKVMYHGTSKGGHTVFDTYGSNYGLFGQGSYFTDNKSVAESYTNKGKGNNKQVYETYLNITNPIDMDAQADVNAWAKALPDADFTNCTTNEDCYRAMEEYFEDEQYSKYEASEIAMDAIQGMGYDGITHIGGGRVNADGTRHQVYIAFEPEQIKNIDNIAPTKDADIRYSLTEDDYGHKLTKKQQEFFKDSKVIDSDTKGLMTLYHGSRNPLFTEFNTEQGVWLTPDQRYAEVYADMWHSWRDDFAEAPLAERYLTGLEGEVYSDQDYRLYKMYANIVNPLDLGEIDVELTNKEISKLARMVSVSKTDIQNIVGTYNCGMVYDVTRTEEFIEMAREKGYDGFSATESERLTFCAFDAPNQVKLTSNKNPSADADVRYSLSDSEQSNNDVKVLNGNSIVKYSLSTWTPETQTKVRNNLIKAGYDGNQVDKWIKDTNGVASVIAADKDRLDFVAADNQVMLKDNQEYIKTLDASTLCAKRLVYQGTFDAIQHRMPNTMLSSDDLIDLLNMMKEHGVQTPCGVCYVESRRRHLGKFAQDWLNNYNGEYKPNLDEVTTSDGLEALRKSHPQTYKDFVDAMNRKGSSNPKVVQLRTEYRNEIMSLTPSQISKIEAIGGLRVQSFSDFETPHLLDMMQAVMDMSAKGLHSQAYTKVPNFAWVFGDTGIKINLSLIAEGDGFDSDGNLAFSSVEGMDFDEAMRLRDAYSQNVGTIIVGANDKHILACMADDRIDFIIPFHRSGWGMKELEMMGMTSYTDYTYGQKEHDLETGKGLANLYPPDYWDYTLSGKENAERYLNLCAKTGREPKFSRFLVNNGDGSYSLQPDGSTDGYWKTLIDFKMYDNEGNGAAQQKVQPNFNMVEAYRVLNEYEGGANSLPVANDVVEEFVAKHKNGTLHSLSEEGETFGDSGNLKVYAKDIMTPTDIAPTISKTEQVEDVAPTVAEDIAPTREYEAIEPRPDVLEGEEAQWAKNKMARADKGKDAETKPTRRSELHQNIVDSLKDKFKEKGFDFDEVLKKAKNLSTFATVDNIPQRVMEKALGYKQGQILADETVNKVAQNESEGIKWLNSFTDRKNGVLAQISKQYNIKPGSKKSAAAQMYAEGFYVDKDNKIIKYGDEELAIDFPDAKVQENIKGLARDERIRQIYDDTLTAINESRKRNLYPEIPRLDNYFLHFRAMEDTFSRLGLPFNPNDIRAKDLPTDLNGVTADLKPGQPYFASAMHREGMRTSFDLLGGLERYLSSAKNQIYHIDDIQTLRALRNYIADSYGQGKGLEGLDNLSEEEIQEKIKQVYGSHLSTFAKFLNEEANVLAGKTPLIDRGVEGIIGRRGITFLNTLNGQVGSNMVGWNISSSLTNFLPVAQTLAKGSKVDFTKAFAQTVASKIGSIFGKTDSFVENNPTIIRRKGAERFYRTPFQKIGDTGYVLMSAVDDISTELIVRTKYNELVRKGMDEQKASFEADKWTSRLMGDRSLGQQPQLYNSKVFGLITKFQLEVRNQLDSQFYDTIQETKVSNEKIENGLLRNAKTAAKVTSVFVQLAAVQHLYGMVFESIAGYNPAFDIVEVLIKTLGFDDDEEDEDTVLDNIQEGFLALLEDLPYTSTLTGGRIPISSALPIGEIFKGKDQYGNEVSRLDTLKEAAPYYFLPTGFGQIKKTVKGLDMFSDEHPVTGSYTDSGSLRFPVEDTPLNRIQAGIFGQYANENARTYFDEGYAPLKEKQIQEYKDVDMPIADYWKYREGLAGLKNLKEKGDYIGGLDLPISKKNILINNIADRETPIDMTDYNKYSDFEEFDFATRYPEKYAVLQQEGISVKEYKEKYEESAFMYTDDFSWAANNPEKYTFSKAITDNVLDYREITSELYAIRADKDSNGKTINGSAKKKKKAYIWSLDIDDGAKYILFKNEYNSVDDYNDEIVDYLNSRDDITYDEMNTILEQLGAKVDDEGYISW